MPQLSRPIADVSRGLWTPASSPPTLWDQINGETPIAGHYVTSSDNPSGDTFVCKLAKVGYPEASTDGSGYTLTVDLNQVGIPPATWALVALLQGGTVIAYGNSIPTLMYPIAIVTLPDIEVDMITNWGNLSVAVTAQH